MSITKIMMVIVVVMSGNDDDCDDDDDGEVDLRLTSLTPKERIG